jgi:hypothetical protein
MRNLEQRVSTNKFGLIDGYSNVPEMKRWMALFKRCNETLSLSSTSTRGRKRSKTPGDVTIWEKHVHWKTPTLVHEPPTPNASRKNSYRNEWLGWYNAFAVYQCCVYLLSKPCASWAVAAGFLVGHSGDIISVIVIVGDRLKLFITA